jgi:hypothetical protein
MRRNYVLYQSYYDLQSIRLRHSVESEIGPNTYLEKPMRGIVPNTTPVDSGYLIALQ